jgi:hypothetical protein
MNHTLKPVPSRHYRDWQRELWRRLEVPDGSNRNAALSIEEELEAEFVHAWGFSDDTDGRSLEMKMMAARHWDGSEHCFDHCTCYYESETESHVVVTQPYLETGEAVELLTRGLVVPDRVQPGIIAAPEWAFYYPVHATLIVVRFPPGYERILKALDRLWSPAAQWGLTRN